MKSQKNYQLKNPSVRARIIHRRKPHLKVLALMNAVLRPSGMIRMVAPTKKTPVRVMRPALSLEVMCRQPGPPHRGISPFVHACSGLRYHHIKTVSIGALHSEPDHAVMVCFHEFNQSQLNAPPV